MCDDCGENQLVIAIEEELTDQSIEQFTPATLKDRENPLMIAIKKKLNERLIEKMQEAKAAKKD